MYSLQNAIISYIYNISYTYNWYQTTSGTIPVWGVSRLMFYSAWWYNLKRRWKDEEYQGIWGGLTTGAALYQPWGRVTASGLVHLRKWMISYALPHSQEGPWETGKSGGRSLLGVADKSLLGLPSHTGCSYGKDNEAPKTGSQENNKIRERPSWTLPRVSQPTPCIETGFTKLKRRELP